MRIRLFSAPIVERYGGNAALIGLLMLLYAPLLLHWVNGWLRKSISIEHEYFSHGVIGLPFAAYVVWVNRKRWQRLVEPSQPPIGAEKFVGALLLLVAGTFYLSGLPDFVNLSLPVLLAGVCLWLKGLAGLKLQSFALLLVFLATPSEIPYLIAPYTLPLQSFIAGTAGFILNQLGLNVTVEQIYLYVNGQIVEVAPYCAGLKMLFTSLYVALMLLYWTDLLRSRIISILFLGCTAMISVSANILRNTLLTYFHGTGKDQAFDWLHQGWGGDVYSALMLGVLVGLVNLLDHHFSPAD